MCLWKARKGEFQFLDRIRELRVKESVFAVEYFIVKQDNLSYLFISQHCITLPNTTRLNTQFTKGNLKCSNWEFYLRDVYIHFMEDGGKDLALPRCMLRMGTKHFVAPSDSTSATDRRSKSRDFVSTIATRREERRKRRENIPSLIAL